MIRPFKPSDLDELMLIWLKTNCEAHHYIAKSYWESNFENVKELLPQATIMVAENKQTHKIEGFIGTMATFIAGIFVDSSSQSNGIGKLLLDSAKAHSSELLLEVYQKNTKAIAFYQREDFVITAEKHDEDTNEAALVMKWTKTKD
ncbi:GNAT family N-acetyltransferase [Brochothrix thermosphacta]|uniref:GNAT family N-acetyltransferase n=1 Tax=Brochothrix thermosphacta TaxID=2756 RepID=UPI00083F8F03|nr:GNAT family N-acetyltransferase [Brochothrix thermosphacta]ODJ62225.1 GNAT family N-acetyltransferase [Brochothrix thermosphacta]ODJ64000.1 GNAT family N-acetyltransferase [Brochothrix thermosphacta]SPN72047.1 putative acetyltransferase [Brochothrix thermosphacta]